MLRHYEKPNPFGMVTEVHIADIHFGAVDPEKEYNILCEQFLTPISNLKFDILAIDGDLFDKKFLASSPAIDYANRFVMACVELCKINQATMIVLAGTKSHDADQLSMFYGLQYSDEIDFRIVEHIQFEYAKGLKILCIPEEYGKPTEYYTDKLSEIYDTAFMHGTVVGSVYGANKYTLESKKAPVFSIEAFSGCKGPIICGHVHKAACYNGYIYYVSNPIRYKFGEEEEKGYGIVLHSPYGHMYKFMPIESFRYVTINRKDIQSSDPNDVIQYLVNLQNQGIEHIRIDFSDVQDLTTQTLVEKYITTNPNIAIKRYNETKSPNEDLATEEIPDERFNQLSFLINPDTDPYTKFVQFVNYNENKTILTVEQLKAILSGKDINSIF